MKKITKILFAVPMIAPQFFSISSCGQKKSTDKLYDELKESTIEYFTEWCKHPHPTYYFGPLNKWLTQHIESKYGVEVHRDDYYKQEALRDWPSEYQNYYGNIWFDIPASEGYENYPSVILQCHMDMVIDGMSLEDAKTTPIVPSIDYDKNIITSKDNKTSLGADDGAGSAMVLALIANEKVKHGPLRILFTADEEDGLIGAKNLGIKKGDYEDEKIDVIGNIKYLINVDNEKYATLVNSSGGIRYFWYNTTGADEEEITNLDIRCTSIVELRCSGARGGHSAGNIIKHANALKCLLEVIEESGLASNNSSDIFQFISATTDTNVVNAIPSDVTIKFATSNNDPSNKISIAINSVLTKWKSSCPDEKDLNIIDSYDHDFDILTEAISNDFSKTLFSFMNNFTFGVVDWIEGKEDIAPASSQNIGPLTINCSSYHYISDVFKFGSSSRSCYNDKLQYFENECKNLSDGWLGEGHYDLFGIAPPYAPKKINPLRDALMQGYVHNHINPELYDEHGGLEISYFAEIKNDLNLASIGPTIDDCHNKKETLHLDTIVPTLQAIVYALVNI